MRQATPIVLTDSQRKELERLSRGRRVSVRLAHIRTTNPIESTFATVRLRHKRTKGNGSHKACLAMVYKLTQCAEKRWRKLNGSDRIPDVISGVIFIDGERQEQQAA